MRLNDTSIYTTPLKFSEGSFPTTPTPTPEEPISAPEEGEEELGEILEEESGDILEEEGRILDDMRSRSYLRRQWDMIESITNGVKSASASSSDDIEASGERQDEGEGTGGGAVYEVPQYTGPVHYKVPKTGYYCVGTFPLYFVLLHSLSIPSPSSLCSISSLTPYHLAKRWMRGIKLINRNRTRNIIKSADYH